MCSEMTASTQPIYTLGLLYTLTVNCTAYFGDCYIITCNKIVNELTVVTVFDGS